MAIPPVCSAQLGLDWVVRTHSPGGSSNPVPVHPLPSPADPVDPGSCRMEAVPCEMMQTDRPEVCLVVVYLFGIASPKLGCPGLPTLSIAHYLPTRIECRPILEPMSVEPISSLYESRICRQKLPASSASPQ